MMTIDEGEAIAMDGGRTLANLAVVLALATIVDASATRGMF